MQVHIILQIDGDGNPYVRGVFHNRENADLVFDRIVEEDLLHEDTAFPGIYADDVRCAGDEHGSVHMVRSFVV